MSSNVTAASRPQRCTKTAPALVSVNPRQVLCDTDTAMDPDINRQFQALFDAHDEAFRALRAANTEMGRAIQAHDEAIEAAIAANRAALNLVRRLGGDDSRRP
jgi:hypothetical protein